MKQQSINHMQTNHLFRKKRNLEFIEEEMQHSEKIHEKKPIL